MRAHARAPYAFAPALLPAAAGKHAKPSEQAFDYRQPCKVDLGRAAVIAEVLRECGYPDCTVEVVTAELVRPGGARHHLALRG